MAYCVLLVNDNTELAHLGKSILKQKGFEVLSACNDDEVRMILRTETPIDLILLDSRMSMIYNWQILRVLRTSGCFAQIPIMMVTGQHYLRDDYFYNECAAYIRNHRSSSLHSPSNLKEFVLKEQGFMFIPNPNADTCQVCLTRHTLNTPHCKDSLYYQCTFHSKYGRWPTWSDAIAHCTSAINSFSLH